MRAALRGLASAAVLAGGGGGLAVAQDALQARTVTVPPRLATDADGPLFELRGMVPGRPPVERCITVSTVGGTTSALRLSGTVTGALAEHVRESVEAGTGATGPDCQGFAPERELWRGALAAFPAGDQALEDGAEVRPGAPRSYRFRAWLADDAPASAKGLSARQDVGWSATLDAVTEPPPTTPTGPGTGTDTGPGTGPGTGTMPTTPTVPDSGPRPGTDPALPAGCVRQPLERPTRTWWVNGHRVAVVTTPARRLREDEPLELLISDPRRQVRRVTYTFDGVPVPQPQRAPWRLAIPLWLLRRDGSRVVVRMQPHAGRVRYGTLRLRPRDCPPVVRVQSRGPTPSRVVVDVDAGQALRAVDVRLPSGVRVDGVVARATQPAGPPLAAPASGSRLRTGPIPAGVAANLRARVVPATRAALRAARCARTPVRVRLVPASGKPIDVEVPLGGRGGGCS